MAGQPVIIQKFPDFAVSKPEIFVKTDVSDGEDFDIIKTCEDAFLCHAQTAGHDRKIEAAVCLENPAEHTADQ